MTTKNLKKTSVSIFILALPLLVVLITSSSIKAQAPPSGYMSCAKEGEGCYFEGTREVMYGIGTSFIKKTATNYISCGIASFGSDPAPNILKQCYLAFTGSPVGNPNFTLCGKENANCQYTGVRQLMYGAGNNWAVRYVSAGGEGVSCSYKVFGDPAPNVVKECYYSNSSTTAPQRTFNETYKAPLTLKPKPIDLTGFWDECETLVQNSTNPPSRADVCYTNVLVSISGTNPNFAVTVNGSVINAGFNGTAQLSGDVVTLNNDKGTLMDDNQKIQWNSTARHWIKRGPASPGPNPNLTGTWKVVSGRQVLDNRRSITQTGASLQIYDGDSRLSPGTLNGNNLTAITLNRTATVSENGTKIKWSNDTIWLKQSSQPLALRAFPGQNTSPLTLALRDDLDFNQAERTCVYMTQDHVINGYGASGSEPQLRWKRDDVRALCKGSVVPMKTVECYIGARDKNLSLTHEQAIAQCGSARFTPPSPGFEDPDVFNNTPKAQTREEVTLLFEDTEPLGELEYRPVLKWLSLRVAAERLPFCWRQQVSRSGVGVIPTQGIPSNYLGCTAGYEREGSLCMPKCQGDYERFGVMCAQKCPMTHPFQCGSGCSKDSASCDSVIKDQIVATGSFAINVITFGAAKYAYAGGKAADSAKTASKLKKAYDTFKTFYENYQKAQTAITTIQAQIDIYSNAAATNFAEITSPEINDEIDRRFGRIGAYRIKKKFAAIQLAMLTNADNPSVNPMGTGRILRDANTQATAKNIFTLIGLVDPIGIVDLENAYYHPTCEKDFPFPKVTPFYQR